jgi:hypothetical protein
VLALSEVRTFVLTGWEAENGGAWNYSLGDQSLICDATDWQLASARV